MLFSSLLKYCSSERTFSVLPASQNCDPIKSWTSLSCCHSKYLVWFAFQEDLPSQNYIWIMGKDGEPTMERPSHPQQKSFKQHTHPSLPVLVWRKTEKIWWQKKKIENWGGGGVWGRFLREARVGCRWNNRWGRSFIIVSRLHTRQYHPITWGQLQYHTVFLPLLLSSYFPFYLMVFSIVLQKFFLPCVKYSFIADINSWLRTCWVFNVKPPRVHRTFEQKKFLTEILMILKYQMMTT